MRIEEAWPGAEAVPAIAELAQAIAAGGRQRIDLIESRRDGGSGDRHGRCR
jgi:hypothetical protein